MFVLLLLLDRTFPEDATPEYLEKVEAMAEYQGGRPIEKYSQGLLKKVDTPHHPHGFSPILGVAVDDKKDQ